MSYGSYSYIDTIINLVILTKDDIMKSNVINLWDIVKHAPERTHMHHIKIKFLLESKPISVKDMVRMSDDAVLAQDQALFDKAKGIAKK